MNPDLSALGERALERTVQLESPNALRPFPVPDPAFSNPAALLEELLAGLLPGGLIPGDDRYVHPPTGPAREDSDRGGSSWRSPFFSTRTESRRSLSRDRKSMSSPPWAVNRGKAKAHIHAEALPSEPARGQEDPSGRHGNRSGSSGRSGSHFGIADPRSGTWVESKPGAGPGPQLDQVPGDSSDHSLVRGGALVIDGEGPGMATHPDVDFRVNPHRFSEPLRATPARMHPVYRIRIPEGNPDSRVRRDAGRKGPQLGPVSGGSGTHHAMRRQGISPVTGGEYPTASSNPNRKNAQPPARPGAQNGAPALRGTPGSDYGLSGGGPASLSNGHAQTSAKASTQGAGAGHSDGFGNRLEGGFENSIGNSFRGSFGANLGGIPGGSPGGSFGGGPGSSYGSSPDGIPGSSFGSYFGDGRSSGFGGHLNIGSSDSNDDYELDRRGSGINGGPSPEPGTRSRASSPQASANGIPRLVASPAGLSNLLNGLVQAAPSDQENLREPRTAETVLVPPAPEGLSADWTETRVGASGTAVEEIAERVLEKLEEKLREDILRNYGFLGGFP